jgi:hypothetical protein
MDNMDMSMTLRMNILFLRLYDIFSTTSQTCYTVYNSLKDRVQLGQHSIRLKKEDQVL